MHSIYYIDFRKKRNEKKNKHTTTSFRSWLLLVRKCMSYTYNVFVIYLSFIHEKKKRKIEAGAPSVLSTIFQFGIRTLIGLSFYIIHTQTHSTRYKSKAKKKVIFFYYIMLVRGTPQVITLVVTAAEVAEALEG